MARQALVVNTFVYPDGSPVANGSVNIRLSSDGSISNTQVQRNFSRIKLDANGVITGSPTFQPNSSIAPPGSYYVINVYSAQGQLVAGPNKVIV